MPTLSHVKEEPGAPSPGQDSCKGGRSMCRQRVGQRSVARFLLIAVLLSLSMPGGTGLPAYAEARDGLSCNPWSRVSSPGAGTSGSELDGVAVVSASDIWAVGSYFNLTLNSSQTLVEHWNGSHWQVVTSPNVGTDNNDLSDVAVDLSGGVWTVGTYFNTAHNHEQTLIERGHGGNWQVVPSPNAGIDNNDLHGVAVELSGNAWAVGSYFDPRTGSSRTLIERWNGSNWNIMPSPNVGKGDNRLSGVTVELSGNAWAVGEYFNRVLGNFQTLIEHWDGRSWQVVPSLNVGSGDSWLNDVTVDFSGNAWAVGDYADPNNLLQTLVEHWNGIGWQVVPSANPGASNSLLLGVDGGGIFSPVRVVSRVWAVGYSGNQTLIEASPNQVACS